MKLSAYRAGMIVAISLTLAQPVPAAPPDDPGEANPAVVPGVPAAEWYGHAINHLKRGRWFDRAALQLKEAVREEPDESAYHLALGCALASRAASLRYAASFAAAHNAYRAAYPEGLAAWEKAQKDPKDPLHGTPRPKAPAALAFRTKDDNRPFTMTPTEAEARVASLRKEAKAAWERGTALARGDAERAEAAFIHGWGLRLLRRSNFEAYGMSRPPERAGAVSDEAVALFETATRLAPANASYWQALGDAHQDREKATAAYRRSLALNDRNPALWYRLYQWEVTPPADDAPAPGVETTRRAPAISEQAAGYLRRAAEADPRNAFPLYQLAALKFKETRYGDVYGRGAAEQDRAVLAVATAADDAARNAAREAISLMERGNGRPEYRVPRYRPVVTPLLVAAWEYGAPMAGFAADGEFLIRSGADLRELARAACGYALVAAQRNDLRDADRAARAAIGAGFKVIGDWPVEDSPGEGKLLITALVGKAIVAIGYTCLQKVYEQARDSAKAERVAAEYAAFKQRSDAHGKIVRENLSRHPVEIMLRSY